MIFLEIDKKKYKIKQDWSEITIKEAIKLCKIPMPERLKQLYQLRLKDKGDEFEFSKEETIKEFPNYYGKVIRSLSNIPKNVMDRVLPEERTEAYYSLAERFILGVHYSIGYEPKGIDSFTWNIGKEAKLFLPKSLNILGTERPMANESVITFTEVSDLLLFSKDLEAGNLSVACNIIAILCRQKDEEYNEGVSLKRAAYFDKLPMSIYWEVFFCLIRQLNILEQNIQIYSLKQKVKRMRLLKRWGGMAKSLAYRATHEKYE